MLQASSPNISDILSKKFFQDVKREPHIFEHEPAEVVDLALQELQKAGVELIEWRAVLYRRMNVPILIKDYSYLVPDHDLEKASDILAAKLELPLSPSTKLSLNSSGDFSAQGRSYRITKTQLSFGVQHLILYPMSFSTLSLSETSLEFPYHIEQPSRCTRIRVPRPSAVYASIIRMMLNYPRHCATRVNLQSDLSELIGYHLLELANGYVDPSDDGLWEDLHINERIGNAIDIVRGWNWDKEWQEGQEWIGEALVAVIAGDDIANLPYKS